jgi:hypothetical protein
MKNSLIYLLILLSFSLYAQRGTDAYIDLSVAPNKILDFDLEVGARANKIGVYLYYGRFDREDYQNYGMGIDYYLTKGDALDIAVGASFSNVMRKQLFGLNYDRSEWGTVIGWASRVKAVYYVFPKFGISGRLQYQRRPDLEVHGIVEGSIGILFKFAEND